MGALDFVTQIYPEANRVWHAIKYDSYGDKLERALVELLYGEDNKLSYIEIIMTNNGIARVVPSSKAVTNIKSFLKAANSLDYEVFFYKRVWQYSITEES